MKNGQLADDVGAMTILQSLRPDGWMGFLAFVKGNFATRASPLGFACLLSGMPKPWSRLEEGFPAEERGLPAVAELQVAAGLPPAPPALSAGWVSCEQLVGHQEEYGAGVLRRGRACRRERCTSSWHLSPAQWRFCPQPPSWELGLVPHQIPSLCGHARAAARLGGKPTKPRCPAVSGTCLHSPRVRVPGVHITWASRVQLDRPARTRPFCSAPPKPTAVFKPGLNLAHHMGDRHPLLPWPLPTFLAGAQSFLGITSQARPSPMTNGSLTDVCPMTRWTWPCVPALTVLVCKEGGALSFPVAF